MPRLSIVIPTIGNRAALLARAVESARAQTSKDVEILVSDNASPDDETRTLIGQYAKLGLRTFRHESRMSAGQHTEFLIAQSRGEYFHGLSDDDYLEPEFAAETLAAFDRNPNAAFVYTGCAVHYEDVQLPCIVGPALEPGADFLLNHYSDRREICWCACVTRTRDLRELAPMPEDRVIGDMFFWTKLTFRGPVVCVPRVLAHYILLRPPEQNDNVSHGTSPLFWTRESMAMVDDVLERSRQAGASPRYLSSLAYEAKRHVARSAANQFVWTRIRGASWFDSVRWIGECLPYFTLTWPVISRVGAAILVPPTLLRRALLKSAERMAAERNGQATERGFRQSAPR